LVEPDVVGVLEVVGVVGVLEAAGVVELDDVLFLLEPPQPATETAAAMTTARIGLVACMPRFPVALILHPQKR
jgi:hypothetical protein